jgi:hypothetical protein
MQTLEQIAYDAGLRALADQESLVSGIRQRTGTIPPPNDTAISKPPLPLNTLDVEHREAHDRPPIGSLSAA